MTRLRLATYALLLAAVTANLAAGAPADDIRAAAGKIADAFGSLKSTLAAGSGATELGAAAGLGVREAPLKAQRLTKKSCGTKHPSADEMASIRPTFDAAKRFQEEEDAARSSGMEARLLANTWGPLVKRVNVYWHVIRSGNSPTQGNLSKDQINKQMAVLNQKLGKANIQFDLASLDYTTNADWYSVMQGSGAEAAMKAALHQGTLKDFNVYSAAPRASTGEPVAGFTDLPMFSKDTPEMDGSVILFGTLPGGSQFQMNLGMTLVHEAGHWLGLLHTFDNGCDVILGGDTIGDTPYEDTASFDCTPKNTCPDSWGMDPIHNPMNYSPDSCMTQFSTQQCKRMRQQWYAFRQQ